MGQEDKFEQLLKLDPLAEAEKVTGRSYKDDDFTEALGMALMLKHSERKRDELSVRNDTYYGMSFAEFRKVIDGLGFEVIYEKTFTGKYAPGETLVVFWKDGVLGKAESFTWEDGVPSLNSGNIYYNWESTEGDPFQMMSSGTIVGDILVGHHDIREGLVHNMGKFLGLGRFVTPWVQRPFLWLLDYTQADVEGYDYRALNEAVIAELPAHVREAITTGEASE